MCLIFGFVDTCMSQVEVFARVVCKTYLDKKIYEIYALNMCADVFVKKT